MARCSPISTTLLLAALVIGFIGLCGYNPSPRLRTTAIAGRPVVGQVAPTRLATSTASRALRVTRQRLQPKADLGDLPVALQDPQVQVAAGAAGAVLVGGLALLLGKQSEGTSTQPSRPGSFGVRPKAKPGDAVAVFGATGQTGREVVKELLNQGRKVVGYIRTRQKWGEGSKGFEAAAEEILQEFKGSVGSFTVREADVTKPLSPDTLAGVNQLVLALGPIKDEMTSEDVDYKGVANIVNSFKEFVAPAKSETSRLFEFGWNSANGIDSWSPFGAAESDIAFVGGSMGWSGQVKTPIGGGFAGIKGSTEKLSLQNTDSLKMRIRGDGNRYKFMVTLKNGKRYQCPFDTAKGLTEDIELPLESFVPLVDETQNTVDYSAQSLVDVDKSQVESLGILASMYEFNSMVNPRGSPETFSLGITSIDAVVKPQPQIVLVSSAAVERNLRVDDAQRESEIPIVKLNPGGVLNWKYLGETVVRDSGLSYSIVRPCGLVSEEASGSKLELSQGDRIAGLISRREVAALTAAAVTTSRAEGKTFEARRCEAKDAVSPSATELSTLTTQFQSLVRDVDRYMYGLPMLPAPLEPASISMTSPASSASPSFIVYRDGKPVESAAAPAPSDTPSASSSSSPSFVVYRQGKAVVA
mmetsp:Transcript_21798/g.42380  ORF Transcript_21798/g.42380 Transcript_21798/m.42380 type:complete len:642 (-) Transcript_21798:184-2109(-)